MEIRVQAYQLAGAMGIFSFCPARRPALWGGHHEKGRLATAFYFFTA
jgi:hypothetical protein